MSTPQAQGGAPADSFLTVPNRDVTFQHQSVYISGHSFDKCTFSHCTLIVKDFTKIGVFTDCKFEDCIWDLSMTVHDREAWTVFLTQVAPAITMTLPNRRDARP